MKLDFSRIWRRKKDDLQTSPSLAEPSTLHCPLFLRRDGIYCRGCVRDNETGKDLFDEHVATRPLMESLLGSTDEPIMTCECGEPGCAGFWDQESRLSETRVHWWLRYKEENWDLLFDRDAYENSVLAVLGQFMEKPWEDTVFPSGTILAEYPDRAAFAQAVDALLARSPRLSAKWETLCSQPQGRESPMG
jgi:hypothetical protein